MNLKEYLALGALNGLKAEVAEFPHYRNSICNITGNDIDIDSQFTVKIENDNYMDYVEIRQVKPICFPFSFLTKEIQIADYNSGEPFIPIVELAKISFPKSNEIRINSENECVIDLLSDYIFEFKNNSFQCTYSKYTANVRFCHIQNQLKLFQKLISWHFPVGLSEQEFIKITEEFNPYN